MIRTITASPWARVAGLVSPLALGVAGSCTKANADAMGITSTRCSGVPT